MKILSEKWIQKNDYHNGKQLKEDKIKGVPEISKSIQNMKIEFKVLKKPQTEKMLEMKISKGQLEVLVESLTNKMHHAKIRDLGIADKVEELDHLGKVNEKN